MIDNPNPNNFYSDKEMVERQNHIAKLKERVLKNLEDLTNKVKTEEPFPHGNIDLEALSEIYDSVDGLLNGWYY